MSTNIIHTASSTTRRSMVAVATEPVTGTHLLEAAYAGTVSFHKERAAGTLRRWPVLAPESKERKAAEALRTKVENGGVAKAAKAAHTSVATVRRTLVALSFTEELEAMNAKEKAALAKAATANGKAVAEGKPAKVEPTPEAEKPAEKAEKTAEKKAAKPAKPRAPKSAAKGTKAVVKEEQPQEAPTTDGE